MKECTKEKIGERSSELFDKIQGIPLRYEYLYCDVLAQAGKLGLLDGYTKPDKTINAWINVLSVI